MFIGRNRIGLLFLTIVILSSSILFVQLYFTHYDEDLRYAGTIWDTLISQSGEEKSVILWWTPFGNNGQFRKCGNITCYFTHNRTFESHKHLQSILFYGSNIQLEDLPSWRSKAVTWGLLHEESPRNNPMLVHPEALALFNYSSTFSRSSDVPLTLIDLPGIDQLTGNEYFLPFKEKIELMQKQNLAPLLYIQSDCNTASSRDLYISELMKYIRVDSYGACLNNAQLEESFKGNYLESLSSREFLSFVGKYMFTIAFENAVCEDYITEKLWRPLVVGSVPVYYGSPTFKDWLPSNETAISVLDFDSPKDLADYLYALMKNETAYHEFLTHKLSKSYEIRNTRLLEALRNNPENGRNEFGHYVDRFECFVCSNSRLDTKKPDVRTMTVEQYDCPLPKNPLTKEIDENNWWLEQWIIEKCGAKLLANHLKNNLTIDSKSFETDKLDLYYKRDCE